MTKKHSLARFMEGFAAAAQLLERAGKSGFFVEYICLAASVIDATLRVGLILQHQLDRKSSELTEELLLQTPDGTKIPERAIYKRALERGVIDQSLFDQLEELYRDRNRVVHRYIISEITSEEALNIACRFERILPLVSSAVGELEARQIDQGVGMTERVAGEPEDVRTYIAEMAVLKHGHPALAIASGGAGPELKPR